MFMNRIGPYILIAAATAFGLYLRHHIFILPRLSPLDEIFYNAQGTFPASRLPKVCVNIHFGTASGSRNLTLLRDLGAACARSDGNTWEGIETSKGFYNWTSQDSLWLPICSAGISVIMIVAYNNTLYASSVRQPIAPGANTAAFANFATVTANRYASTCPGGLAIEVFNEPNLPLWTTSQWTGSQYAPVLTAVASAIKAAQPKIKVYSGGVSPGPGTQPPNTFIAEMTSAAPPANVDGYGLHPYNFNESPPPQTPPPEQILVDLSSFASAARRARQAIVNTEYGFPYQAVRSDLKLQARYVARAMLATIIGGYPLYTNYDLIDDGTDYTVDQNTFGLFCNGNAKSAYFIKPAGVAFKTITGAMAGTQSYSVTYDYVQHLATIAFTKSSGKTFAIETWDESSAKSYSNAIGSFSSVSCKDVLGGSYKCSYSRGRLSLVLTATSGPVIIVAR
jgi:hypothetical protein